MAFVIGPPELTLATMPLQVLSHTAGTLTISKGRKALLSRLQVQTEKHEGLDASVTAWRVDEYHYQPYNVLQTPVLGLGVDKQGSHLRR